MRFRRPELLREAMTHASWNNERGELTGPGRDNERLEYLGDAVLELVVGEYLFRRFPTYDEGQLTQLRAALVNTTSLARLAERLALGETLLLGRGAAKTGARELPSLLANAFEAMIGHRREYMAEVLLGDGVAGSGSGKTKQAAEQAAARDALDRLATAGRGGAAAAVGAARAAARNAAAEPARVRRRVAEVAADRGASSAPRRGEPKTAPGDEGAERPKRGLLAALRAAAEALVGRQPAPPPEPEPPARRRSRRGRRGGRGRGGAKPRGPAGG